MNPRILLPLVLLLFFCDGRSTGQQTVDPTGITFGPDGALYISNIGYGAPPVGAGQILKVELMN
jgi:hypothetical protein